MPKKLNFVSLKSLKDLTRQIKKGRVDEFVVAIQKNRDDGQAEVEVLTSENPEKLAKHIFDKNGV